MPCIEKGSTSTENKLIAKTCKATLPYPVQIPSSAFGKPKDNTEKKWQK